MPYKHTQIGYLILASLLTVVLLFAAILFQTDGDPVMMSAMLFILFFVPVFGWLRVEIDDDYLRIKFGIGLVRKRFSLNKIASAVVVRNHWYYGWGIRLWLWPQIVIFNVSGFDAVEIRMASGRIYRIGTDEPQRLEQAIAEAIK